MVFWSYLRSSHSNFFMNKVPLIYVLLNLAIILCEIIVYTNEKNKSIFMPEAHLVPYQTSMKKLVSTLLVSYEY